MLERLMRLGWTSVLVLAGVGCTPSAPIVPAEAVVFVTHGRGYEGGAPWEYLIAAAQFRENAGDPDPILYDNGVCIVWGRPDGIAAEAGPPLSVGPVTIEGPWGTVVLKPGPFNLYFTADLPAESYEPGTTVRTVAPGDEAQGFELQTILPSPVDLLLPDPSQPLEPPQAGEPYTVRWVPGEESGDSALIIQLLPEAGLRPHAGCVTDDDGELVIPADVTTLLTDWVPGGSVSVGRSRLAPDGVVSLQTLTLTRAGE